MGKSSFCPRNVARKQVGRHVVVVLSLVVRARCGNFCENDALFRDFREKNVPFLPTFQSGL